MIQTRTPYATGLCTRRLAAKEKAHPIALLQERSSFCFGAQSCNLNTGSPRSRLPCSAKSEDFQKFPLAPTMHIWGFKVRLVLRAACPWLWCLTCVAKWNRKLFCEIVESLWCFLDVFTPLLVSSDMVCRGFPRFSCCLPCLFPGAVVLASP